MTTKAKPAILGLARFLTFAPSVVLSPPPYSTKPLVMSQTESPATITSILLPNPLPPHTTGGSPRARFLSRIKRYTTLIEPLTPRLFLLLLLDSDVLPAETPELNRSYLDGLKGGEGVTGDVDVDGLLDAKKYSQAIDKSLFDSLTCRLLTLNSEHFLQL